jgi:hypothetical protein
MNTPYLPEDLRDHWIGPVRTRPAARGGEYAWSEFAARLCACSGVDEARVSALQQVIVSGHYVCDSGAVANAVLAALALTWRH